MNVSELSDDQLVDVLIAETARWAPAASGVLLDPFAEGHRRNLLACKDQLLQRLRERLDKPHPIRDQILKLLTADGSAMRTVSVEPPGSFGEPVWATVSFGWLTVKGTGPDVFKALADAFFEYDKAGREGG
jgi:hypothetical protein